MMCFEQRENCFRLNPRGFANNNLKLHCFVTILTLMTLWESVHIQNMWSRQFLCHILKHKSLMLFGDCDGNSLTILKLQPENFWLTLLWTRCTTLTVDLEIFYRKLLATVLQKARPILAPSSPGVVFPEQWTTHLHCASWLVACLSTMMADWYHVKWNDKHILTKYLFIAGGRHEPGNVQRKLTLHRQGSIKNTRSKLLSLFII